MKYKLNQVVSIDWKKYRDRVLEGDLRSEAFRRSISFIGINIWYFTIHDGLVKIYYKLQNDNYMGCACYVDDNSLEPITAAFKIAMGQILEHINSYEDTSNLFITDFPEFRSEP